MNRKQRRAMASQQKKAIKNSKGAQDDVGAKMALFGHLPDACTACNKPFDKKDQSMVMSWHVTVREKEEKVNLYCPPCWSKAMEVVKQLQEDMEKEEFSHEHQKHANV